MDATRFLALALDPARILTHRGFDVDPWQRDFLAARDPYVLLNCCRQAGKSEQGRSYVNVRCHGFDRFALRDASAPQDSRDMHHLIVERPMIESQEIFGMRIEQFAVIRCQEYDRVSSKTAVPEFLEDATNVRIHIMNFAIV